MAQILFDQVRDFTGGINYRADQFQLAKNETPRIMNLEIDPRGGIFTRAGYKKKHPNEITVDWKPKGLFNYKDATTPRIMLTTGYETVGTIDGKIYQSTGGNFSTLQYSSGNDIAVKSTNGSGMTQWLDTLYFAIGKDASQMYKSCFLSSLISLTSNNHISLFGFDFIYTNNRF